MPRKKLLRLRLILIHKDGTEEEVNFKPNWDAIEAGYLRHQKAPEIRRLGQREPRGMFRRIGDD